jgi:hypothetical protein
MTAKRRRINSPFSISQVYEYFNCISKLYSYIAIEGHRINSGNDANKCGIDAKLKARAFAQKYIGILYCKVKLRAYRCA